TVHPNMALGVSLTVAALMACASLLYAMAGQAGGTAFLAIMAFGGFPAAEMRPTALLLNIIAAGYATWLLQRRAILDWKMIARLAAPSLATAFAGGLLVLTDVTYAIVTGLLLIVAAILMVVMRKADRVEARPIGFLPAALAGAGAGFVSGLTGVGGGVFLTPILVGLRWYSPKGAAAISPPFILCNSIVGLAGAWLSGQRFAASLPLYAISVLGGAIIGTATGLRWMSERATRYVLAAILLLAGLRLIAR
ncbi:MAG: sulfite exporter TauE/SafE family protein, partial [Acetobacteraceae bacterium]